MTADAQQRNRNRLKLLAIAAVFFGPILLALLLNANGWIPKASTQGEQFSPPVDLRGATLHLADGTPYAWAPETRMRRLLVIAPARCDAQCASRAQALEKLRSIFGRDAEHLELLWMGDFPAEAPRPAGMRLLADDPAIRARLPRAADPAGAPVFVVDPYGFVILRYAPGTDIALMRKDLSRLLKLQ